MDKKENLDGLKSLALLHRSAFDERRRREWKVVFTSLSFYVLSVVAVYSGKVPLLENFIFTLLIVVLYLGLSLFVIFFLAKIHMANNKNKIIAEKAERAIENVVRGENLPEERIVPVDPKKYFKDARYWVSMDRFSGGAGKWAWLWQSVILFIFAITSAILLVTKPTENKVNDSSQTSNYEEVLNSKDKMR